MQKQAVVDNWEEIGPLESDIVITSDHGKAIAVCDSQIIATASPNRDEDIYTMVKEWMTSHGWYPNVYILSDHGNYHLTEVK